jgi:3-deoxy-manno-octulosonate cytidylyltransferase (CMP-KDO synthetase)
MERNPLVVVSSRIDTAAREANARGSVTSDHSNIATAVRRAEAADIGCAIVDCHDDASEAAAREAGAYTVRTDLSEIPPTHNYKMPSGIARVAHTVTRFDRHCNHDLIIHMPEHFADIDPRYLRALMYPLASNEVAMATLVGPLSDDAREDAPKVRVEWNENRKVYVMPEARVGTIEQFSRDASRLGSEGVFGHIPVYLYRRSALDRIVREPPSDLELDENIEAIRVLDLGLRVEALLVPDGAKSLVDDPTAAYD